MADYQYLFLPLPVGNSLFKNRIIWGPHVTNAWPKHVADENTTAYYEERAAGGAGAIIIGGSPVDETANYSPFMQCGMYDDACIPGLREIADAVHRHDTKLLVQLIHPGVNQSPDNDEPGHHASVAPSQIPSIAQPSNIPRPLSVEDIHAIQDKFASAAERAQKAGLDGVEIHAAHSYLISAFISLIENKRTDEYGGSLENRSRFLLETIDKVRQRVGPDFIVGYRISTTELVEGGMEPEDVVEIAKAVEATGQADYVHCSVGMYRTLQYIIPPQYSGIEPGFQGEFTAQIRAAVKNMPVFVVGRINDPMLADRLIADGSADACVIVREMIAEPEFANKAKQGHIEDIRPCAYWNQSCVGHMTQGIGIECQMNAATGNELKYGKKKLQPAAKPKHVLVVGGGPAGLEFARLAASRGHRVTLHERSDELGGQTIQFARLPNRAEVRNWLDWLIRQVKASTAVTIRLGSDITETNVADILAADPPDEIVVASGARAAADGRSSVTTEPIPGHDGSHVLTYEELLEDGIPDTVGKRVLIVDELADRIAPGIAEMLAEAGHECEIVTRWQSVGHELLTRWLETSLIYETLDALGVKKTPDSWIYSIGESSVTAFNIYTNRTWEIAADTVVLVTMKYSNTDVIQVLQGSSSVPVHTIGDATAPRQVADAVREATRVAFEI